MGLGLFTVDVSGSHSVTHTTLGRTPLDEFSARRRDLNLTTLIKERHPSPQSESNPLSQQAVGMDETY